MAGVPLMDSLSYVFLAYASFCLALMALGRGRWGGRGFHLEDRPSLAEILGALILGAVLMVTLDIVIDPLALRGYRWFLGQIYGYPEPAVYFGITLSNFAGWFLVGLVLIRVLQFLTTGRVPPVGGPGAAGIFPPGPCWAPASTWEFWDSTSP